MLFFQSKNDFGSIGNFGKIYKNLDKIYHIHIYPPQINGTLLIIVPIAPLLSDGNCPKDGVVELVIVKSTTSVLSHAAL